MGRPDDPRFERFFTDDYDNVVAGLSYVVGSTDVAAEAVAEAVAMAWERTQKGEEIESLAGWIRTVALNLARGTFKRRAIERRVRSRVPVVTAVPAADAHEAAFDVQQALAKLSRREREVVVLHYFMDCSVEQIAADLKISESTVRNFLRRARATLAAVVERPRLRPVGSEVKREVG